MKILDIVNFIFKAVSLRFKVQGVNLSLNIFKNPHMIQDPGFLECGRYNGELNKWGLCYCLQ